MSAFPRPRPEENSDASVTVVYTDNPMERQHRDTISVSPGQHVFPTQSTGRSDRRVGMFCETCLDVLQKLKHRLYKRSSEHPLTHYFIHHRTARELNAAAELGCYFCHAIWNWYSESDKQRLIKYDEWWTERDLCEPVPNPSNNSRAAVKLKEKLRNNCMTHCNIQPASDAREIDPDLFQDAIEFNVFVNQKRELPSSTPQPGTNMFLLQRVRSGNDSMCVQVY